MTGVKKQALFSDYHFGFSDGCNAIDCIYLLNGLISNTLYNK